MSLQEITPEEKARLCDRKTSRELVEQRCIWQGRIIALKEDLVRVLDEGEPVIRQYTQHPGAVGVFAMRGQAGEEEVLLLRQYRHPVSAELWEIPAGLLDIEGEDYQAAAARELAEETDLEAGRWDVLADLFASPGGSSESLRIFLARDLSETEQTFTREDEEATMVSAWVSLDEAVSHVLAGRIHNPTALVGILSAAAARARNWQDLRPSDAPWMR